MTERTPVMLDGLAISLPRLPNLATNFSQSGAFAGLDEGARTVEGTREQWRTVTMHVVC